MAKDLADGAPRIAVTTALKIQGSGGMSKAESGWHFGRMPTQTTADIVCSEPVAFVVRKPAPAQPLRGQACMDQKLVEFRNAPANIKFQEEAGIRPRVPYEVYGDWADECGYVPARSQWPASVRHEI